MKEFEFIIVASGVDISTDEGIDQFYEAGCDDATISYQNGLIILDFCREAKNYIHAVVSARHDVIKAGAVVLNIEPDVMVSLSDIACRLGVSRTVVTYYWQGKRLEGFPPPVARIASNSPMWDWEDIARWSVQNHKIGPEVVVHARTTKLVNKFFKCAAREVYDTVKVPDVRFSHLKDAILKNAQVCA